MPAPSHTCHRHRSPRTAHGPSWPRSRSTSPAPPEPWPRSSTPRRPPPRSAPNSSPFPGASPARPARSTSTCHGVGPGNTPGKTCSPPPAGLPARQPDHPTPTAQRTTPRGRTGQTGRCLMPERENPQTVDDHTPTEIQSVHPGSVVRRRTPEHDRAGCRAHPLGALAPGHLDDVAARPGREYATSRLGHPAQYLDVFAQPQHLGLEGEDSLDPGEVDALVLGEPLDLPQRRDVAE